MPFRHDLHILTGVYAVGAVDDVERKRIERHLDRCPACAHEVRGLNDTATRLAFAVAEDPPPELKAQVLAAVAQTRQNPPLKEHREPVQAGRRQSAWMPRLAGAAAAVAFAVAVALGVLQSHTQSQLDQAHSQLNRTQAELGHAQSRLIKVEAQRRLIEAILGSHGARVVSHHTKIGGLVTVVFSHAAKKMVVTTSHLPPLPHGKVYELWLLAPNNIRPAGLLPAAHAGRTTVVLASGLQPGDLAGITVEPAGGSPQPTSAPIVAISSAVS
ncbi:MAG: anti-sigma factor [Actinomycetota bacterium]